MTSTSVNAKSLCDEFINNSNSNDSNLKSLTKISK